MTPHPAASMRAAHENLICMAATRPGDFDLAALYTALDDQRRARGLTWAGVTREINRPDAHPVLHPVSVSSVTGTSRGRGGEGNIVLLMLLWLNRTPESFVPGHPAPAAPGTLLPRPPADRHLRWDAPALHTALNAQRQERGMTWKQVAEEIGGCTPGMLTGLAKARHLWFPQAMRLVGWLGQPAARFTVLRVLRSPQPPPLERVDGRWVSAVALYGPKTGEVRKLLDSVQATIQLQLGAAFLPYSLDQIHGTLIALNAVREPATGALISQYYLEHQGARRVIDFKRVLEILEERFSRPLPIRIGGFGAGDETGFTSQGRHPHERTFSARNGALVLMGWPVSTLTSDGARRPLDEMRRAMNDASVLHRYHATAADIDNDFYLVLGHYANAAEGALAETERIVRRDLERHHVDVRIGLDRVRIVAADSPTLAPARFAGRLPLTAGDLARLYN